MIRDGHTITNGDVRTTDVCIIGGGAAGITIARELRGSGLNVILLEGGGLEAEPASTRLYEGTMVGTSFGDAKHPATLDVVRLRYFGGTTNHWAGYCRPQAEHTVAGAAHRPRSGWPIPYAELTNWYEHVALMFNIDSPVFDAPTWSHKLGLAEPILDHSEYVSRVTQFRPVRFGSRFRSDLEAASDIEVVIHANVTEVLINDNTDVVRGVAVAVLGGPRFVVEARVVVVAVGGIENARLLLASNSTRTAGIGNANDLVGRYFCEHPTVEVGYVFLDRTPKELALYAQTTLPGDEYDGVTTSLVAQPGVIDEHHLLDFEAVLLPSTWPDRAQGDGVDAPDVARLAELVGGEPTQSVSLLVAYGEQELNPASRIRLTTERDALGIPKLELNWRLLDIDRASMMAHTRAVAQEIGRQGIGRVRFVPGAITPAPTPTGNGSFLGLYTVDASKIDEHHFDVEYSNHHMCTTRMATSASEGVVDPNCRVHGLANLYVAGSSVFPVSSSTPPTFTITALAARLADHLARTWSHA